MARRMKDMGLRAGMPDLLVLGTERHFFIEVKRVGGRLSPEQVVMHTRLRAKGWDVLTVFGYEDAVTKIAGLTRLAAGAAAAPKVSTARLAK